MSPREPPEPSCGRVFDEAPRPLGRAHLAKASAPTRASPCSSCPSRQVIPSRHHRLSLEPSRRGHVSSTGDLLRRPEHRGRGTIPLAGSCRSLGCRPWSVLQRGTRISSIEHVHAAPPAADFPGEQLSRPECFPDSRPPDRAASAHSAGVRPVVREIRHHRRGAQTGKRSRPAVPQPSGQSPSRCKAHGPTRSRRRSGPGSSSRLAPGSEAGMPALPRGPAGPVATVLDSATRSAPCDRGQIAGSLCNVREPALTLS